MSIIATFNGFSIVALPSDTVQGVSGPSNIEWDPMEMVSETNQAFGFQDQIFDWMQSAWSGQLSFPPMTRYSADHWSSFILQLRGMANGFLVGDPKALLPKGNPKGAPVVNGASQTGYSLLTRGWLASTRAHLFPGDHLQIGYRLYKVLDQVNSDSSGHATINLWPNLRDQPGDGAAIILSNCKGLFRLQKNEGNKWSTNLDSYGVTGLAIREAGIA